MTGLMLATLAGALAVGGWIGMRLTEDWFAKDSDTDLATFLLTVDIDTSHWATSDLPDEGNA